MKNIRNKAVASSMKIRRATFDDLDSLVEIEIDAFSTPWSQAALGVELSVNDTARYFVAEKDGKIIGYGGMWVIIDEAHITNLAVLTEYRGQGVGQALVDALKDQAREENCRAATLEVRLSNLIARRLYEKSGFAPVGIRPRYYSDNNEDALIMWCMLK